MSYAARLVAARAYESATGRDHRKWSILRYADGVYCDTGERWILYHVKTRAGYCVWVIEKNNTWTAGDVIEAAPEEIAI